MKQYFVYILASKKNGTLYIGITSDLLGRVWQHKNKVVDGFTKKYDVSSLVYYEQTEDVRSALSREKQLKNWKRKWKIELIEKENPKWIDMYDTMTGREKDMDSGSSPE
jgi:putative endonuclease